MFTNTTFIGTNDTILIALCVVILLLILAIISLVVAFMKMNKNKKNESSSNESLDTLLAFQSKIGENISQMKEKVDERLEKINEKMNEHMVQNEAKTQANITDLKIQIAKVMSAQQQIANMETTVNSLRKTLEGNQTRGQFGERMLHAILENVFIDNEKFFDEQYTIKTNGETLRPDAVVFAPSPYKMVCIDSKFAFQNYAKLVSNEKEDNEAQLLRSFKTDLKKHIEKVSKYIIKNETADFSFLFIPNEAIYVFIHNKCGDLVDYADRKKVIICSPSTLYPFLSTLLSINIDYQRKEHVDDIIKSLTTIKKNFDDLLKTWNDLFETTYLTFTKKLDAVDRALKKTDKSFSKIDSFVGDDTIGIE